jgi:hypothetical protein
MRAGYIPIDNSLNIATFNAAVWRLHATIFAPYLDWAEHQRAQPFPGPQQANWDALDLADGSSGLPALLDLCTYFCLWTEAANVRHMPEALWFLFWSAAMRSACQANSGILLFLFCHFFSIVFNPDHLL